jgi:hypothetical protein
LVAVQLNHLAVLHVWHDRAVRFVHLQK